MKERDKLQEIAAGTKDTDDWRKYKHIRNRINNRLKYEENNW